MKNFCGNFWIIFLFFAPNIDCGYKLEPPLLGGSSEYQHSMFWSKNKKNRYTPSNVGFTGVYIARTYFPDDDPFRAWGA